MPSAREEVVRIIAQQAQRFDQMPAAAPATDHLDERDARLAIAIHRTVIQRWITLEYLLELNLTKAVQELEPAMQAVLLTGAAQLLFMQRLPAHAVVNESVELAKRHVRPGAAGMTNAVLRRTAELLGEHSADEPWEPGRDRLPLEGGSLRLSRPVLPPIEQLDEHLAVATSHPLHLVRAWRQRFGDLEAQRLLLHSLKTPPLIVRDDPQSSASPDAGVLLAPHITPPHHVWQRTHADLLRWLARSPHRWAQDPTAAKPVEHARSMSFPGAGAEVILDLCAGRGTKTRQLAIAFPQANVIATDPDADRFRDLKELAAIYPRISVVPFDAIHRHDGEADLVLIDVPCSNTGVLARRLEARYRYTPASIASLVKLQRQIIESAAALLSARGTLLYSTCSIEEQENQQQARWAASRLNLKIKHEEFTLLGGEGVTYHDGGYFAVLR